MGTSPKVNCLCVDIHSINLWKHYFEEIDGKSSVLLSFIGFCMKHLVILKAVCLSDALWLKKNMGFESCLVFMYCLD